MTNKAKGVLILTSQICKKNWGLTPNMAYWTYMTIVKPIITYAASIWWPKSNEGFTQTELKKLQGLACRIMTGAMKRTPISAIEVMFNLPPLHLDVQYHAFAEVYRLLQSEDNDVKKLMRQEEILELEKKTLMSTFPSDMILTRAKNVCSF